MARCTWWKCSTLGLAILLLVSGLTFRPVTCIEANISPQQATLEVGTDLEITCTLTNASGTQSPDITSRDIVWYKNQTKIHQQEYEIVDVETSKLTLLNVTIGDADNYYCGLSGDTNTSQWERSIVRVGYVPRPALSLTCWSHNIMDYTCEWVPFLTNLPETHIFQFQSEGWQNCPTDGNTQPNKCTVKYKHHGGYRQYIRVISTNDLGTAEKNKDFNPDLQTVPLPPSNIELSTNGATSIHAEWELPPTWYSMYAFSLKYRLRWTPSNAESWSQPQETNNKNYDINLLDPYTTYKVQVAAVYTYHELGQWGDWSEDVLFRTLEDAPTGEIKNSRIIDEEKNSLDPVYERDVHVGWDPVQDNKQHGTILGYNVTTTPAVDCKNQEILNDTAINITEIVISGLENFCSYSVSIKAYNSVGTGPPSYLYIGDKTQAPNPPTGVTSETLSHQSIRVSWNKPTTVEGYIASYTIFWMRISDNVEESKELPPDNYSVIIDNLEGYVMYRMEMITTNKKGNSGRSNPAVLNKTFEWVPSAAPTNVTVDAIVEEPTHLRVDWIDVTAEEAHGIIRGHYIYYCFLADLSDDKGHLGSTASPNETSCIGKIEVLNYAASQPKPATVTGVKPFSQYRLWMSAYTNEGQGPRSDHPSVGQTSEGEPSAPQDVAVSNVTSTSIELTWSPPLTENGVIRSYIVIIKSQSHPQEETSTLVEGENSTCLVEGLYGYENYTIQVQACTTSEMCGTLSDEAKARTHIGVPEKPASLDIKGASGKNIQVNWTRPHHPNGPISHYCLYYRLHPQEEGTVSAPATNSSSPATAGECIEDSEWTTVKTTDTIMTQEFACEDEADKLLVYVHAVNRHDGVWLQGEFEDDELGQCPAQGGYEKLTKVSKNLLWLIVPGGVILLLVLVILYFWVQTKTGRSFPEPKFQDFVKNPRNPMPRAKKTEKEEFNTITDVGIVESAVQAEDYLTSPTWNAYVDLKNDKDIYRRTLSTDSGVPPSPQGNNDFSSCEDVFDHEDDFCDSYSFNPKTICSHMDPHIGKRGRSASSSSADGCRNMPVIKENGVLDSYAAKIMAGVISTRLADVPSVSISTEDSKEGDPAYYSILETGASPASDAPVAHTKVLTPQDGEDLVDIQDKSPAPVVGPSRSEDGSNRVEEAPSSLVDGYVSTDMLYNKMAIRQNPSTEETTFKTTSSLPAAGDGYVPSHFAYSVLAVPAPSASRETGSSSGYVSGESLAYSKLSSTGSQRDSGNFTSTPPPSPSTSGDTVSPYVTVANAALPSLVIPMGVPPKRVQEKRGDEDQQKSETDAPSVSDMPSPTTEVIVKFEDIAIGANLEPAAEDKSEIMGSQEFELPALVVHRDEILTAGLISTSQSNTFSSKEESDNTEVKQMDSSEEEGRSRNESTSSSSGYLSDSETLVSSHYVSPPKKPRGASQYANLAYSSDSESQENHYQEMSGRSKDVVTHACKDSAEMDSGSSQALSPTGDDGYVPCTTGTDSGYVLRLRESDSQVVEDYAPMSPIRQEFFV